MTLPDGRSIAIEKPFVRRLVSDIVLTRAGCAPSPYERGGTPQGLSQRDVERDYMKCAYKARLANGNSFYNQSTPFPSVEASKTPPPMPVPYMDSQQSTRCAILVSLPRDIEWRHQDVERGVEWLGRSPCSQNAHGEKLALVRCAQSGSSQPHPS